jgi:hypothetical protein
MPHRFRSSLVPIALAAALLPAAAGATTMLPRSVEDLARASVSVVRATTLSTHAAWDAQRRIVTTVRLRALESISGDIAAGKEFEIRSFGGVVDGTEMIVIGSPRFTAGEEVVLFLTRDIRGGLETVDMAQGKLEVTRSAAGIERLTRRDLESVEWARGTGPDRVTTLTALRARITAALHPGR